MLPAINHCFHASGMLNFPHTAIQEIEYSIIPEAKCKKFKNEQENWFKNEEKLAFQQSIQK